MIRIKKHVYCIKSLFLTKTEDFHFKTRVLQLFHSNFPRWRFIETFFVFTHDQVPIAISPIYNTTVENKGITQVYGCTNINKDDYR